MKALLVAFLALFAVSACNTIEGAGEDLQSGGEAISDTANEVKQDM